jgi:hypothetical protein
MSQNLVEARSDFTNYPDSIFCPGLIGVCHESQIELRCSCQVRVPLNDHALPRAASAA